MWKIAYPPQTNTRLHPRLTVRDDQRGSAIMGVLAVGLALSLLVGAAIRWGMTEKKINNGHVLRHEAKNAAEAVSEYGFAELISRFTRRTSFPLDDLKDSKNPLLIPPSFDAFFSGSGVSRAKVELKGGMIPPGEWRFINPNDPANEFDPLRGKRVFVREVEIFSRATAVRSQNSKEITAFIGQRLQVRDAPLFGHGIFYNMDLEFHPGGEMDFYGPVHSNTDTYFSARRGITFHEGATSAGHVYHGLKKLGNHAQQGPIRFKDANNTAKDMYLEGDKSVDSSYLDSRQANWRQDAAQRWDGALQDVDHGVPTLNPAAFEDYVPDDPFTAANELENSGYAIIEPLLPSGHPNRKSEGAREQKMAAKAGMVLRVEANTAYNPATDPPNTALHIKAYKYLRENVDDPKSDIKTDAYGDPILLPVTLPDSIVGDANSSLSGLDAPPSTGLFHPEGYAASGSNVSGGMYDHREDKALTLFSLDVGELKAAVEARDPSVFSGTYNTDKDWNGVVYVEYPTSTTAGADGVFEHGSNARVDNIVPGALDYLALQAVNASSVPNPVDTIDPGFTLATNAPLYLVGNFNADGNSSTGGPENLDNSSEPPAAVAADTLTVLSNRWGDNGVGRQKSAVADDNPRPASYTEISAAILTGLKPTVPDDATGGGSSNAMSGGTHNFPRLLEKWSGQTLTIRGSLVALFESEVHTRAMPDDYGHYYAPPRRDWGFNKNFRDGHYPPGTPMLRTFRRVQFRDLSKTEYDNLVAARFGSS